MAEYFTAMFCRKTFLPLYTGEAKLPGCDRGGAGDNREYDFCYDPSERDSTALVNRGDSGSSCGSTCQYCQGDFYSDSDCEYGLMCFMRATVVKVPWCISGGIGDKSNSDICINRPCCMQGWLRL